MAKGNDKEIERRLHQLVLNAVRKGETITKNSARSRVEVELGLQEGLLKSEKWKERSKVIIDTAVLQAQDEDEEETGTTSPSAPPTPAKPVNPPAAPAKAPKFKTGASNGNDSAPKKADKPIASSSTPTSTSAPEPESANANGASASESSDSEGGSDSESESESDSASGTEPSQARAAVENAKATPAQANGLKRKADDQSTFDSTTSSRADGADVAKQKNKKARVTTSQESTDSGSEGEGGGESEGVDAGQSSQQEKSKPSQTQVSSQQAAPASLAPIPSKPFTPPTGFQPVDLEGYTPNATFSPSNMEGKQIWHITVPSDLPASSITEVALDAIQTGNPILTHNDISYVISEEPKNAANAAALFIPTVEGYQQTSQSVTRKLNIQPKIILPYLTARQASQMTESDAASSVAQPAVSSIHSQPKGLRMRYKPPGFGPGRPGRIGSGSESSDDDDGQDTSSRQATFQFPKALGGHGTGTQQGANDLAKEVVDSPAQKPKKKRKDKEREKAAASPVSQKSVQHTEDRPAPVTMSNGVKPSVESPEDRARRKEEKRLRREKKAESRKARALAE